MFLFSGTFFPVSQLPDWIEWVAWITPLWHGVDLARAAALPEVTTTFSPWVSTSFLVALTVIGTVAALRTFKRRLVT
jgi:lipooligosaccharide transport system permease protein